MTNVIGAFAPEATIYCYRIGTNAGIVNRDKPEKKTTADEWDTDHLRTDAFLDPLKKAINDEIDILNLSGGWYHNHAEEDCVIADTLADIDNESLPLIVAAAGNKEHSESAERVHCPGRIAGDTVLSVGGFEALCPCPPHTDHSDGNLWVDTSCLPFGNDQITKTYCSFRGCTAERSCQTDSSEELWPYNLRPINSKPDLYAPVQYVKEEDGYANLLQGTSFAAPTVTGMLASLLGDFPDVTITTLVEAAKRGEVPLRRSGNRMDVNLVSEFLLTGSEPCRFDMEKTLHKLEMLTDTTVSHE